MRCLLVRGLLGSFEPYAAASGATDSSVATDEPGDVATLPIFKGCYVWGELCLQAVRVPLLAVGCAMVPGSVIGFRAKGDGPISVCI